MSKRRNLPHTEPDMASEQTAAYRAQAGYHSPVQSSFKKESIMAKTMSVDEYFDKLLSMVHDDYANI